MSYKIYYSRLHNNTTTTTCYMSILLDHGDKKNLLNVFISATADIPCLIKSE